MQEAAVQKAPRRWWLLLLLLCPLPCILPFACALDPQDVLDQVPLGSKYVDLDGFLTEYKFDDRGEFKYDPLDSKRRGYDPVTSEPAPSNQPGASFTGEVRLYISGLGIREGEIAATYILSFYYVNGKLVKKDWGRLPG